MARSLALLILVLSVTELRCNVISKRSDEDTTKTYQSLFELILSTLVASRGSHINIPDVDGTFGGFWLKGKFQAAGGVLSDLSTLTVQEISVATTAEGSSTVDVEATMDTLQAAFGHFQVSTRFLSTEGNITARVWENLIDIQVRVSSMSGTCTAVLSHVKLRRYGSIEITDLNVGSSTEEFFVKQMMELAEGVYVDKIISKAEKTLHQLVSPFVQIVCEAV